MGYRFVLIIMSLGRTHVQRVGHEHSPGCDSEDELVMPGVGISSPSGTARCMFIVATGTAPRRIQRASHGTSFPLRRGYRPKKNRPTTRPPLACWAPETSCRCVAPGGAQERWLERWLTNGGRKDHNYTTFEIINI